MQLTSLKASFLRAGSFLARHKCLCTCCLFVLYMLFFDKNNFLRRWEIEQEITTLETEKEQLSQERDKNSSLLDAIDQNQDALEKVAREKYMMKKEDRKSVV